eukprot:TRINITY_DN30529_c0_g1_i1.p1 TRINITY_DN30529_c0_g1~~TRINITY_DN30529_c0_g1_i1.p1  ORF type:complete len:760 (+),score=244.44 TRINITY_DN30529_c0_g1_i1:47-2326(+)
MAEPPEPQAAAHGEDGLPEVQPFPRPAPVPALSSAPAKQEAWDSQEAPDSSAWTYYVFHPYGRLFTAVSLTLCNFMLYGEDPIVHAYTEAELPVAGQALGLLALRWPDKAGVVALKILIAVVTMLLGLVVGRVVVHSMVLRDMCRLRFCGWEYHDVDDVRTTEVYKPWKTLTPYNRTWWGGAAAEQDTAPLHCPPELSWNHEDDVEEKELKLKLKAAYQVGYERGMAATRAKGVGDLVLGDTGGGHYEPKPYAYTREEYQDEHETALELLLPFCFKPRKHFDHSKGSVLVMFGTAILVMALGATAYNAGVLSIWYEKDELDENKIGPGLGMNEYEFGKFAAVLCWFADLLNLVCAFDCTFQEVWQHRERIREGYKGEQDPFELLNEHSYKRPKIAMYYDDNADLREVSALVTNPTPRFKLGYVNLAPAFSRLWNTACREGWPEVRVIVIWIFSLTLTILILVAVCFDVVEWDNWTEEYGFNMKSTELGRLILASTIAIQGPLTVIQDLEWPSFSGDNDISLPGMNIDHVSCDWCPSCTVSVRQYDARGDVLPKRKLPFTTFFITNKWITFIPFVLSLCLDYSMLFACWEYHPSLYGQYVNPENQEICITRNETYALEIKEAWETSKVLLANYTVREEEGYLDDFNGTDFCVPSRYTGVDGTVKFWVAIPGVLMYAFFIYYLVKWTRIDMKVRAWESPKQGEEEDVASPEEFLAAAGYCPDGEEGSPQAAAEPAPAAPAPAAPGPAPAPQDDITAALAAE